LRRRDGGEQQQGGDGRSEAFHGVLLGASISAAESGLACESFRGLVRGAARRPRDRATFRGVQRVAATRRRDGTSRRTFGRLALIFRRGDHSMAIPLAATLLATLLSSARRADEVPIEAPWP
jgi:hypothetical protein